MVFCLILGCLISLLIIPLLLLPGLMHSVPFRKSGASESDRSGTPRFGGVALLIAFIGVAFLGWILRPASLRGPDVIQLHLIWGALIMACLGAWNDYRQPSTYRLLALQAAVAAALFSQGLHLESFETVAPSVLSLEGMCGLLITVLWLVSLTNLPRLMDKVTGLAGILSCLAFVLVAIAGYQSQNPLPAHWASGMAGAMVGFLIYNLPPSRVRLGGAGSSLIGFLIGSLTILTAGHGTLLASSVTPFLVLMVLILGAGFAVLRRELGALTVFPTGRRSGHGSELPQRGVKPHAS